MSITKISTIAAAIVVLVGAIAVFATKDEDPSEIVSNPPPPPPPATTQEISSPPELTVAASAGNSTAPPAPAASNEELARLKAQSPHPDKDEFARRLSVKHERLLADLTSELSLAPAQTATLKAVLDARLLAFRAALDINPQAVGTPGGEMEMLTKAGEMIRGVGLREQVAEIFSEEQLVAFDEREERNWQAQIESHAYRELAKITPVLGLSEEQKDRVFALLQTSSAEDFNQTADARAFMSLQTGQSPIQVDIGNMEEVKFFQEAFEGANPMAPDSPEFRAKILDIVGINIRKNVELLAPVLDERQTQRYRDHLYQKSLLPTFGIKLPDPE